MKFLTLVYIDPAMIDSLQPGEYDSWMRDCLTHADELRGEGKVLESRMLEDPPTAKSVRVRQGRRTVTDGPFAETKEVLAGFNLIEADDIDEAVRIASDIPWARTGCIEVRPVREIDTVRQRVFASAKAALGD